MHCISYYNLAEIDFESRHRDRDYIAGISWPVPATALIICYHSTVHYYYRGTSIWYSAVALETSELEEVSLLGIAFPGRAND